VLILNGGGGVGGGGVGGGYYNHNVDSNSEDGHDNLDNDNDHVYYDAEYNYGVALPSSFYFSHLFPYCCRYCAPEQARAQVGFVPGISGSSSYGAAADM
jgi:hypothetical protein